MCAVVNFAEGRCLTVGKPASLEVLVDEASDPITKNRITWTGSNMDTVETLNTTLPGLGLSKEGFLAGTPTHVLPLTPFTFTVSNCGGAVSCAKSICVQQVPPCLSYQPGTGPPKCDCTAETWVFTLGQKYTLPAKVNKAAMLGGSNLKWSVSGDAPKGMSMSSASGDLTFTPTELVSVAKEFKITVTNTGGDDCYTFSYTVLPVCPMCEYLVPEYDLLNGALINTTTPFEALIYNAKGPNAAITSAKMLNGAVLPAGLEFNLASGMVTGTPEYFGDKCLPKRTVMVEASNACGSVKCPLYLPAVHPIAVQKVTVGAPSHFVVDKSPSAKYSMKVEGVGGNAHTVQCVACTACWPFVQHCDWRHHWHVLHCDRRQGLHLHSIQLWWQGLRHPEGLGWLHCPAPSVCGPERDLHMWRSSNVGAAGPRVEPGRRRQAQAGHHIDSHAHRHCLELRRRHHQWRPHRAGHVRMEELDCDDDRLWWQHHMRLRNQGDGGEAPDKLPEVPRVCAPQAHQHCECQPW
jgi:hypothetical protein